MEPPVGYGAVDRSIFRSSIGKTSPGLLREPPVLHSYLTSIGLGMPGTSRSQNDLGRGSQRQIWCPPWPRNGIASQVFETSVEAHVVKVKRHPDPVLPLRRA
jgi:hypothetical protein